MLCMFVGMPCPCLSMHQVFVRHLHPQRATLFQVLTTPRQSRGHAVPFFERRDPLAAVPSGLARRVMRGGVVRRSIREEIEDNDPPVRILLERLGWPVPRALKRQVELRLFVSSPLFFFSLADLFDDERREHGSSSPGERWAFVFN
jgi:hypothetical protein